MARYNCVPLGISPAVRSRTHPTSPIPTRDTKEWR
jgi:hypothetical protein